MTPDLILPHAGVLPTFAAPPVRCGRGSTVIGTVSIGAQASLGDDTVIRGDGETITIGDRFWLGPRSTVHIATDLLPTVIADRVTVGRNAVVHACTVGSDVVIEDDVVVLDGSIVGDGVLIEADSTVFPRSELEPGFVYGGSPARKKGPIADDARNARAARLRAEAEAVGTAVMPAAGPPLRETEGSVFVARTASVSGRVVLGAGSSVFFSCVLDAAVGPIAIGADTNIQDNTVIRTGGEGVVIGRDTTVGHNVRLADCRIGTRSLIGIGCVLAPGTVVADDVMLAGGATTDPDQLLESGHLWGGRPARILSPLDGKRRAMISGIGESYREHGRTYRLLQTTQAV